MTPEQILEVLRRELSVGIYENIIGMTAAAQEIHALMETLQARLDLIADIAEGSGTVNSLPHIAKIARGTSS